LIFDKVTEKNKLAPFLWPTVYISGDSTADMSSVKLDADCESTNSSGMAVGNPLTICGRFPWCAGDIVPCCLFLRTARLTSAFSVYDNTTHSPCTQFQLSRNLLFCCTIRNHLYLTTVEMPISF